MTITVRLPDEIEAKLRERLGKDDLVLTEFVRQAITRETRPGAPLRERTGTHGLSLHGPRQWRAPVR